jgi:hypothetical protein
MAFYLVNLRNLIPRANHPKILELAVMPGSKVKDDQNGLVRSQFMR